MNRIHRSHQGIVHVTESVPYTIPFVDAHVAHLYREEIFYSRLPYMSIVNVSADTEWLGSVACILYLVNARSSDVGKIEMIIIEPKEFAPFLRSGCTNLFQTSIFRYTVKTHLIYRCGIFVYFYFCNFLLVRMITYLTHMYYRFRKKVGKYIAIHYPFHSTFCFSGRYERAHNKPPIVMIKSSIEQLQWFAFAFYHHCLSRNFRCYR